MERFTIRPGRWYVCQLMGDLFGPLGASGHAPTPIGVHNVVPLNTGKRSFELKFFHANYPEGVQDKTYTLTTLHRGESMLLAASYEHDPPRFLYVTELTTEWLRKNWPDLDFNDDCPQTCLKRRFPAWDQI